MTPFGKFGLPYLGKATAAARAMLPSPTGACVTVWAPDAQTVTHAGSFCNPPNSDMDYKIFNVRT